MGPITADASVSRCLAQTRLDWDGREDGRGPDAGRGRCPTPVHRVSPHMIHLSSRSRFTTTVLLCMLLSSDTFAISVCALLSGTIPALACRLRDLPDRSQLSPFRCFGSLQRV
jgi:hypothetical protein